MAKKVLFVHYRTGERDGVSLEIEKRAEACRKLGAEVHFLSGFDGLNRPSAHIVEQLDMKSAANLFLLESFFRQKTFEEPLAQKNYASIESAAFAKMDAFVQEIRPDYAFVHNVFSHIFTLPATTALNNVLKKYQIPTVAVHHDFWFERERFLHPRYGFIRTIIENLPPDELYIKKHQVINSLALENLFKRRGIKAEKIGDYFDFSKTGVEIDDFNRGLRQLFRLSEYDLVILHATRISERKAIENAMVFAKKIGEKIHASDQLSLNGRRVGPQSRVVLFLPNFVEVDAVPYFKLLESFAEEQHIDVVWGWEHFLPERTVIDGKKKFSLWDSYAIADLVTYTSVLEGFGNQFLEAVFFKKLPVLFEYPVFEADIKQEGYRYISLGNSVHMQNGLQFVPPEKIKKAAVACLSLLQDPEKLKTITENNFKIAKEYHDTRFLERDLAQILH